MDFLKGMDISFLQEMLEKGAKFRDKQGKEREVFQLLKENGVNSIRLRIWNEPENVPESKGYCSLNRTIEMAKLIKQNGMSFFLDFHYSDWWADPGKQTKPKAWVNLNFSELTQAVYDYTKDVLLRMEQEEVFPDFVQIGNEIRSGMLFPDGEVPNYSQLVTLVNAGIKAVKETGQVHNTKVVIHLDQGGRYFYLRDWFDNALEAGLDDFDIIGVSYYPFWHGTFSEFKESLTNLVKRYQKPIIVAETAHAWRRSDDGFIGEQQERIAGFPATPKAQKEVIDLVMNITASLEENMGLGIYYWEPVVVPMEGMGGWCSNMGVFNEEGIALPALESFQFTPSMAVNKVAKIYYPEQIIGVAGEEVPLPDKLKVLYYDGSTSEEKVEWDAFDKTILGSFTLNGTVSSVDRGVQTKLKLVDKLEDNYNYLTNGDFKNGMEGWKMDCEDEKVKIELHPEFIEPFPAPPVYYLHIESPVNFKLELSSEIAGLKSGTYQLQVDFLGTNTTGVDVKLFSQVDNRERKEAIIHPTDEEWITYTISDIVVNEGMLKLGLYIVSPPIYGKVRKFTLLKQ